MLITVLLAAILILYVFVGGRGRADARPHCSSAQTLALVKREIVDRAAGLRGGSDPRFTEVANVAVLRAPSTLVRRLYDDKDMVGCSGTLVLDLPPGVAAADGRRSLAGPIVFRLKGGNEGIVQLEDLTNADAIAAPLAAAVAAAPRAPAAQTAQAPVGPPPTQPPTTSSETAAPVPSQPAPLAPAAPVQPPAKRPAPAPARQTATAKPPTAAHQERPAREPEAPATSEPPREQPRPSAPPPQRVVMPQPSFNCRSAHSRGERIVCSNPGLANLDRAMAAEFHRAMAAARPGQRDMLRRSGRRFIHYRDSCPSIACMADAYRGRMREINDIMDGPW